MIGTRLLFIHGNLDVPTSFDSLLPLLPPAATLSLDLEDTFNQWPTDVPVTARTVAEHVTKTYGITANDILIGHSMGGWLAAHIKEVTGATLIQLSSWTNPGKVRFPIRHLALIRAVIRSGLAQQRLCLDLAKWLFSFQPSRVHTLATLDRIRHMNPAYLIWQYELIFTAAPPLTSRPDLRLHGSRDFVISPPDEPFTYVPDGHKIHATNPPAVAKAITVFLGTLPTSLPRLADS